VRCRDGSLRWLEWNAQRLDDFEGHPGLLTVGHDITDRKQAIEDLRYQEARLRAVLDTAVDGIITINERGIVQSVNSAAERIFGYTSEEMIGHNISMLMPSPHREEHDGYLANYLRTGEKKIIGIGREVEARRKNGTTFPCVLAVSEVPLPDQRLFTGIVRDITEQNRA
jgi:two-component system CheB/CheR fusion protein